MDYGHTNPPTDSPEFFTPGTNANSAESKNNLNLTNQANEWNQVTEPIEHNKQAIGSSALNPVELSMPPSEVTPVLGEITERSLQPDAAPKLYEFPSKQAPTDKEADASIVKESLELGPIKATESLNEAGIKRANQDIQEFNQTGDAARLNQSVRSEMMPELIDAYDTSYWTGAKPKSASKEKRAA